MTEKNISKTSCPVSVIIIGSGLVGCAAAWRLASSGHRVLVLEKKPSLNTGGSDIQISPNGVRLFRRLGLVSVLEAVGEVKTHVAIRGGRDMGVIAHARLDPSRTSNSIVVRRDDLQATLHHEAVKAGAHFLFDKHVVGYDDSNVSITLSDGSRLSADIIVGADGVRSSLRSLMFPDRDTHPVTTDQVCFQIYVPYDTMAEDPDTLALFNEGATSILLQAASGRYITAWALHTRKQYFMIFSELKYDKPVGIDDWTRTGDMDEVRDLYKDFPPTITKLLARYRGKCEKWRIVDAVSGADWHSASGRAFLIGDAIHAMPPHAAQGCTQGFEDVAALGEVLDSIESEAEIPQATRVVKVLRKDRTEKVVGMAKMNLRLFTLPYGPEQETRDEFYRKVRARNDDDVAAAWDRCPLDANADAATPGFVKWLQAYDVIQTARDYVQQNPLGSKAQM